MARKRYKPEDRREVAAGGCPGLARPEHGGRNDWTCREVSRHWRPTAWERHRTWRVKLVGLGYPPRAMPRLV